MGLLSHIFPVITLVAYLLAMLWYLCGLFSELKIFDTARSALILWIGLFCHGAAAIFQLLHEFETGSGIFALEGLEPRFATTLFAISGVLVAVFLMMRKKRSVERLGVFVTPLAVLFLLASGILFHFEPSGMEPAPRGYLLWAHIATTVLGHVAFVFAFGVSIALLLQEFLIKKRLLFRLQRKLPALLVLDELNYRFLSLGFLLMLLGVFSGIIFALSQGVAFFSFDARIFWSLTTLSIYALLVFGRRYNGLRGRRAAWYSVFGFCTVLASFISVILMGGGFHVH
jgi:ABC-type uncharacterized transport system permease subunit